MTTFICEKSLQLIVKRKRYWLVDFLFPCSFLAKWSKYTQFLGSPFFYVSNIVYDIISGFSFKCWPSNDICLVIKFTFLQVKASWNHLGCSISRIFFIIIFLVLYFARFIKSSCDSMSSRGPPLPPKFFHISWQTSFICTFPTLWLWSHKMDSVSRVKLLSNDACSSCETLPSSAISRTFQVQA